MFVQVGFAERLTKLGAEVAEAVEDWQGLLDSLQAGIDGRCDGRDFPPLGRYALGTASLHAISLIVPIKKGENMLLVSCLAVIVFREGMERILKPVERADRREKTDHLAH